MDWKEYWGLWWRQTFKGTVARAQTIAGVLVAVLSILALVLDAGEIVSWVPALLILAIFIALVIFGFFSAPYFIHRDLEKETHDLREDLTRADQIESVLVDLGKMRRKGVSVRNDMSRKEVLEDKDREWSLDWRTRVMDKMREISPAEAELLTALDLVFTFALPEHITRYPELVHHTDRLARLEEFIHRYDAMLQGSRGLGKREV